MTDCNNIKEGYELTVPIISAFRYIVNNNGEVVSSNTERQQWSIFPMPNNQREANERESAIGNNLQLRPYNATINGRLWTPYWSPGAKPIRLYFRDFSNGLPSPKSNVMYIAYPEERKFITFNTNAQYFGLDYNDRMFACMVDSCKNGGSKSRCSNYFGRNNLDETQNNIAIDEFCATKFDNNICPNLCNKNSSTMGRCESNLTSNCANDRFANNNEVCACFLPINKYTEYVNKLKSNIDEIPDQYNVLKYVLKNMIYDPSSPHCFYPDCITSKFKGSKERRPCNDLVLCIQGIDLDLGLVDSNLNIANNCLIDKGINIPDNGNDNTNNSDNNSGNDNNNNNNNITPNNKQEKSKTNTILFIGIGVGLLVLIGVIIAYSVKKK